MKMKKTPTTSLEKLGKTRKKTVINEELEHEWEQELAMLIKEDRCPIYPSADEEGHAWH